MARGASIHSAAWQRLRLIILARDDWECRWCTATAATVDHIVPRCEGGSDDPANLVAACIPCQGQRAREQARNHHGWH